MLTNSEFQVNIEVNLNRKIGSLKMNATFCNYFFQFRCCYFFLFGVKSYQNNRRSGNTSYSTCLPDFPKTFKNLFLVYNNQI
jgi:hypothetical protein